MAVSFSTQELVRRAFMEFKTAFDEARQAATPQWQSFALEVPSYGRGNIWSWLQTDARVQEWLGAISEYNFQQQVLEIINRDWILRFGFDRREIEDNANSPETIIASALMAARDQASEWDAHRSQLIVDVINNGHTTTCWDGQNLFDTTHPVNPVRADFGTYNNIVAAALSHASLVTAKQRLREMRTPSNRPIRYRGNPLLLVPPALEHSAAQLATQAWVTPTTSYGLSASSGASENTHKGTFEYLVVPEISDSTASYLVANTGPTGAKPVLFQNRQDTEFDEWGPDSDMWKKDRRALIQQTQRHEAAPGLPNVIVKIKA